MKDVDLIALAGLLHDIGKFGQRAEIDVDDLDYQNFCPRDKNGNPTHKHAAYSAKILGDYIVEKQKKSKRVIKADSLDKKFINISAKHHVPETDEEWIVASADRLASGFERESFNNYNEIVEDEVKTSFKEQKLDHLFIENKKFPLSTLSIENIFAVDKKSNDIGYKNLWKKFKVELDKFNSERKNYPDHIKVQSLEYLLKKYTSFMPSATSFKFRDNEIIKPNISLFEHLKTTSIFSSAIASMNNNLREKVFAYYRDKKDTLNEKVFVLIAGDFFGIQDFIFNEIQSKYAAKTLRAKSAYIQILTKVLAYFVCDELGISYYSIISTHAGKFEILAPNDEQIKNKIDKVQKTLNNYFIEHFFAQTGVGITFEEASLSNFIFKDRYRDLRSRVADKVEEIKYKKFGLISKGCHIFEIEDGINNQNLCDFCHKRVGKGDEYKICKDCSKFVKIGEKLTKNRFLAISKKEKEKEDLEIFSGYYLHFFDNASKDLALDDIAIFDISNDEEFRGFYKWELASYVKTDTDGKILTLEDLAKNSVVDGLNEGKRERGVEAVIALKGDADGMGNFIKDSDVTNSFAKYNFFARMVDYYFSVYVPIKIMSGKPLYTVFAGGDDLFVLGAWDKMIEFSKQVREDFVKFTNKRLTFSTGHIMTKANKPINYIAYESEDMLEDAKDYCCEIKDRKKCFDSKNCCVEILEDIKLKREKEDFETVIYVKDKSKYCKDNEKNSNLLKKDALTLFNETSKWDSYIEVRDKVLPYLIDIDRKNEINTTFLYRLLDLIDMSKKVKYEKDVKSTIWKSKLNYIYIRNISKDNFELLDLLNSYIENYPKELKMVLFEFIYKRRKNA